MDTDERENQCQQLLMESLRSSSLVSLLVTALSESGCPFNHTRHVSCEDCAKGLAGGFDRETNQIVLCANYCQDLEKINSTLAHELVHMYDYCTTTINFNQLEHLACTEVRAANLVDCRRPISYLIRAASSLEGDTIHASCVKDRAVRSVQAIAAVPQYVAAAAVEKIFHRCYADVEPVGRRCRDRDSERSALTEFYAFYNRANQKRFSRFTED